jgi:hypothetical protein
VTAPKRIMRRMRVLDVSAPTDLERVALRACSLGVCALSALAVVLAVAFAMVAA